MYAKLFAQIFDSSIAEDYQVRHVFQDLLALADWYGVIDMTPEAIARRTNVPLELVRQAIDELSKPDPRSRSREADGARLVLLDESRTWGWRIVNYRHYRDLRTADQRREYQRNYKRKKRAESGSDDPPNETAKKAPQTEEQPPSMRTSAPLHDNSLAFRTYCESKSKRTPPWFLDQINSVFRAGCTLEAAIRVADEHPELLATENYRELARLMLQSPSIPHDGDSPKWMELINKDSGSGRRRR